MTLLHLSSSALALISLIVIFSFPPTLTTRIAQQKIYRPLQDSYFCFRRLNATHEIGCQVNSDHGNVGVLHYVASSDDIHYITNTSTVYPMIAILPLKEFKRTTLLKFKQSGRVSGVLVIKRDNETFPSKFSPDQSCPNQGFDSYVNNTKYGQCKQSWVPNNDARGMMFDNWPFPIFLLTRNDSIEHLIKCFTTFNKQEPEGVERPWPLCAAQLDMKMHAAVNTPVCMRRSDTESLMEGGQTRFCDPLASKNLFTNLFPTQNAKAMTSSNQEITIRQLAPDNSVVLVVARLDSFSLFDEVTPAVESSVTGVVTLLSVAETLSQYREEIKEILNKRGKSDVNVIFAIFDGESFDYIGSSATAVAMEAREFPQPLNMPPSTLPTRIQPPNITLSSIKAIIELNQLSSHNKNDPTPIFVHYDAVSYNQSQKAKGVINDLENVILEEARYASAPFKSARSQEMGLPPSSIHSFLREKPYIPGVYLANHEVEYTNPYYNSFLDDRKRFTDKDFDALFTDRLTSISKVVSRAIVRFIVDDKSGSREPIVSKLEPSRDTVSELLECLVNNRTCKLFQEISRGPYPSGGVVTERDTIPLYVSVYGNGVRQLLVNYLHRVMAYLTGENVPSASDEKECASHRQSDTTSDYIWVMGNSSHGTCVKSVTYATYAVSPAFYGYGDAKTVNWSSTKYSTWTESVWSHPKVRIFLKPSPTYEWLVLFLGVIITALSFFVVYHINQHSKTIFLSEPSTPRSSDERNFIAEVAT